VGWWSKPILIYPVMASLAALAVLASLQPAWPVKQPIPRSGVIEGDRIILQGDDLEVVVPDSRQRFFAARNEQGAVVGLRVAVLPNQGEPTPEEQGLVLPLTTATLERLQDRTVAVRVEIRSIPVNLGYKLALSMVGANPPSWVSATFEPVEQTLEFTLPPQHFAGEGGVGIRMVSTQDAYAYGVEIASIELTPQ
jgi:hypothetical protein